MLRRTLTTTLATAAAAVCLAAAPATATPTLAATEMKPADLGHRTFFRCTAIWGRTCKTFKQPYYGEVAISTHEDSTFVDMQFCLYDNGGHGRGCRNIQDGDIRYFGKLPAGTYTMKMYGNGISWHTAFGQILHG